MTQGAAGETSIQGARPPLDQRRILSFFSPLALSWIFMSLEGPIAAGLISRRPGSETGLAGLNVLMALAILVESPVIDLLSTSTTLSRTHASYLVIRRFTGMLMVWTAAVQALVSLTPLYWVVVERWIGTTHEVATALRPAMVLMVPWASFVGWRRFHQGVLIRQGETRPIGLGTALRVSTVFCVGVALFLLTALPGLTVAAIALVASVIVESLFVQLVSRKTIRRSLDPMIGREDDRPVTLRRLCAFHFPLTAATMTMILAMPLVSAALARSPGGTKAMAAWGLASSAVFLFRSVTFALPETVISLYNDEQTRAELGRFCTRVGIWCSVSVLLVYFTGGATAFFNSVLDSPLEIARMGAFAVVVSVLLPLVNSQASLVRGLLTAHHRTGPRFWAITAGLFALVATLGIGVALRADGILATWVAMTLQVGGELAVLTVFWRAAGVDSADLS